MQFKSISCDMLEAGLVKILEKKEKNKLGHIRVGRADLEMVIRACLLKYAWYFQHD